MDLSLIKQKLSASQTKGQNLITGKSETTSHIAQNINDYQYISGSIPPALTNFNFLNFR